MTRIFWKLLLTFFGLLAVAGLGLDYLVTQVSETNLRETLEESLLEQARLAREMLQGRPAGEYPRAVDEISASIGARVTVIRPDGVVLADSQADPAKMENHATRPEFVQAMHGSVGVSTRYSRTVGIDFLYVAIPAGDGYLRLALPLSEVEARSNRFRANVIGVILVAMIPAIFGAAWLARRVSARLSQIITFSQQLAQGNFQVDVPEFRGGELGELGRTLRTTSEQLRSMFEQLQQERSRFEAAINGIGEGVLVADQGLRTILFNPALTKMMPRETFDIGRSLEECSHAELALLFREVFRERKPCTIDLSVRKPVERIWKVSCAPIAARSGRVQAAVAVFYDITEMEKVERLRRDFVANVSHELRTPLASIQGYSETLLDGALEDNENNRRFLDIIRQNSVRLARLTSDLMTLAQIESNARGFLFAPHNVSELVQLAADELRLITERKSITVVVDPMPERLIAFFDSGAIHQVLVNLLDNAAKYTPEGGTITVGARVAENDLVLYVRDTGIGISPDHIPRLFERFYRVDTARSRAMGGTGLGLAIVKHIALAHNGSVRVESEPGKGSTFYFRIPLNLSGQTVKADAAVEVLTAD